jgi:RalA-binding protein 1
MEDDMEGEDADRILDRPSPTKRDAVEDFPLPPSNPPAPGLPHAQPETHKDWLPTATTIQLSVDPPGSSYTQSDQSSTTFSRSHPGAFRALPLLASDLPYTQIKVSHSSIRPNDKGKDVSSFIVDVSPGNGKEVWKVEKLYSDVLALDARVRASVGRGVGKKIASLPEGKLWRDHAPAKVDQRKVRLFLLEISLLIFHNPGRAGNLSANLD